MKRESLNKMCIRDSPYTGGDAGKGLFRKKFTAVFDNSGGISAGRRPGG